MTIGILPEIATPTPHILHSAHKCVPRIPAKIAETMTCAFTINFNQSKNVQKPHQPTIAIMSFAHGKQFDDGLLNIYNGLNLGSRFSTFLQSRFNGQSFTMRNQAAKFENKSKFSSHSYSILWFHDSHH